MKKNREETTFKVKFFSKTTLVVRIAAVITTIIFPCIFNVLSAAGWIANRESYGGDFVVYGIVMIVSSAIMAAAAVLCCLKVNLCAAAADILGFVPCMIVLFKVTGFADEEGWSNKFTMEPVSNMYRNRIMPTIIPFLLILIAAILQFFSYEASLKRANKRREKEKRENAPAPKILGD